MGLATGDCVLVTFRSVLFGQRMLMTLRYVVTVPSVGNSITQDLTDIADAFANAATATLPLNKLLPCQADQVVYDSVRAQRIYPARTVYVYSTLASFGTHPDACTTANISVSCTKRSLFPGRHGLGRVQIPGVPATQYNNGLVEAGYRTLCIAFNNTLVGEKTIAAAGLKVWACVSANINSLDTKVSSMEVQDTLRTMHRRTVRVGE